MSDKARRRASRPQKPKGTGAHPHRVISSKPLSHDPAVQAARGRAGKGRGKVRPLNKIGIYQTVYAKYVEQMLTPIKVELPEHFSESHPAWLTLRTQAVMYRVRGMTHEAIAAIIGVNAGTVSRLLAEAMAEAAAYRVAHAAVLREVDLARTEAVIQHMWEHSEAGDTAAAGVIHRMLERRAKMLGYDSPIQVLTGNLIAAEDATARMADDQLRARRQQVEAEMARLSAVLVGNQAPVIIEQTPDPAPPQAQNTSGA